MKKIAIILGTRPEIIKMSPLIRQFHERRLAHFVLHTGQHYSHEMDRVFFETLELPSPEFNLKVGSRSHGAQTGRMLEGIEQILLDQRPEHVLVQGDTNTVVAGALASSKLGIRIGHVEAGLRSGDRRMPEEVNRIVADHLADVNFAPTAAAAEVLRREGIHASRILMTGNTIVDAVLENRKRARNQSRVLDRLGLATDGFVLLTAHRQENVDDARRFVGILKGAQQVSSRVGLPVIFPSHPRSRRQIEEMQLDVGSIRLVEPMDFLDFLNLESSARLILTDSGGVQEEACILQTPCVTLRDNTERPETIAVEANILAGTEPERIVQASEIMLRKPRVWTNPFGDGHAAERIVETLRHAP